MESALLTSKYREESDWVTRVTIPIYYRGGTFGNHYSK